VRPRTHDACLAAPLIEAGYPLWLMATRSIVTSQPDVTCDVCERRLLRGEQPEVFLAAGEPRTVCELCAPRATHEGWLREADGHAVSVPALRPRRGRNLFERLRQVGRPAGGASRAPVEDAPSGTPVADASSRAPSADAPPGAPVADATYRREPGPYDFLDGSALAAEEPIRTPAGERSEIRPAAAGREGQPALGGVEPEIAGTPDEDEVLRRRAIEEFNASEFPRRVAGVARSLGVPTVCIRPVDYLASAVTIVVAWELCWYRYAVDLDTEPAEVRILAQGTELGALAREDRLANAVVDERGALAPSGT
jgi:hypothetical protein